MLESVKEGRAIEDERYMSEQQEGAANWRRLQDFKAAKSRLASLQAEARELGKVFEALSRALITDPESISVSASEVQFDSAGGRAKFPITDLDPVGLSRLVNDLRSTSNEKEQLFETLKKIGADVQY